MKTKKGSLDPIVAALNDLGANRLPLPLTTRIHNARKAVLTATRERDEIKNDLLAPYLAEGRKSISPGEEGYTELIAKINELWNEDVELELGAPIDLSKLNGQAESVQVKEQTIAVLDEIGLLGSAS